jgi:hypothetical protein
MTEGPRRRLFWRLAGEVDYLLTLVWLRILDALAGPLLETPADQQRKRDRERIERAFPNLDGKEPSAAISHRMDRIPTED